MYQAKEIAIVILKIAEENSSPVTNLKLQKILYYVQAYFLSKYERACFADPIVAWKLGPVIQNVYYEYYSYVNQPICDPKISGEYDQIRNKISMTDLSAIRTVVLSLLRFKPFELVNKTHNETPWKTTLQSNIIEQDKIKAYFDEHPVLSEG